MAALIPKRTVRAIHLRGGIVNIDSHHAATYVVARLAGFSHHDAEIVAHASEYVDDATNDGMIQFDNSASYHRICSAHRMLDYRNVESVRSARVWVPFHFLPGNGGLPEGQDPPGGLVDKLICRKDSPIARAMIRTAITERNKPYGLHRLGIAAHVYTDTWAHQGFTGTIHPVNVASDLVNEKGEPDLAMSERIQRYFLSKTVPLGHGCVLGQPDRPYLVWGYKNGRGETIHRNNPKDYVEAFEALYVAFRRYLLGNADAAVGGIPEPDRTVIEAMIRTFSDPSEHVRHKQWLHVIAQGSFSFGKAELTYIGKGEGSWKHQALGTVKETDDEDDVFPYRPEFLHSNWKLFHDALKVHQFHVVHELLPRFGICTA